ncbi:hypothetical protein PR202_gb07340 [Eleusine coracana subsp. coracana]|uniref:Ubiquitin-like domain-containing protein n=1 Tax=Eleusine coracana subsp. coracana TaxID=191504 RepID=A0AAV5EBZ2_ELECO|nr:hypothetical protein PR202_gb07340 [Eleusine coracana subsp. coracana]
MQIFVRDLLGGNRTTVVEVEPTDTVIGLMERLEELAGTPPILQQLTLGCRISRRRRSRPGVVADYKVERMDRRFCCV